MLAAVLSATPLIDDNGQIPLASAIDDGAGLAAAALIAPGGRFAAVLVAVLVA